MKSLSKIFIFMLITVFCITISYTYAVDLNLTDSIDDTSSSTSASNKSTNSTNTNSTNSSTNSTTNSSNTNNQDLGEDDEDNEDDTTYSGNGNDSFTNQSLDNEDFSTYSGETETTIGTATPADSGLSISDIINIFVIVIGVILMFLGIAILVKSKQ